MRRQCSLEDGRRISFERKSPSNVVHCNLGPIRRSGKQEKCSTCLASLANLSCKELKLNSPFSSTRASRITSKLPASLRYQWMSHSRRPRSTSTRSIRRSMICRKSWLLSKRRKTELALRKSSDPELIKSSKMLWRRNGAIPRILAID